MNENAPSDPHLREIRTSSSESPPTSPTESSADVVYAFLERHLSVGPLPPPAVLKAYDDALPGSAERIVALAEREAAHRHELDRESLSLERSDRAARIALATRGQLLGYSLSLVIILGGFVMAGMGNNLAGFGSVLTAASLLVAIFVLGRRQPSQQHEPTPTDEPAAKE